MRTSAAEFYPVVPLPLRAVTCKSLPLCQVNIHITLIVLRGSYTDCGQVWCNVRFSALKGACKELLDWTSDLSEHPDVEWLVFTAYDQSAYMTTSIITRKCRKTSPRVCRANIQIETRHMLWSKARSRRDISKSLTEEPNSWSNFLIFMIKWHRHLEEPNPTRLKTASETLVCRYPTGVHRKHVTNTTEGRTNEPCCGRSF